jgi:hypothetical protein
MPYKDYQKQVAASKASYARLVARTTPQERTERKRHFPSRSYQSRRRAHLKERYGLTLEQWEAMFEAQGRKCAICSATTPGWKRAWHTDHDHKSGAVRGILCHLCNRTLANYGIARFQSFIAYLSVIRE